LILFLGAIDNPPAKTLQGFLHLVDDSDIDFKEELGKKKKLTNFIFKYIHAYIYCITVHYHD